MQLPELKLNSGVTLQQQQQQQQQLQQQQNDSSANLLARLTAAAASAAALMKLPYADQAQHRIRGPIVFDANTTAVLETIYASNDDPGQNAIDYLARELNLSSVDLANWFQAKRNDLSNDHSDSQFADCIPPQVDNTNSFKHHNIPETIDYNKIQQSILETILATNCGLYTAPDNDAPNNIAHSENGSRPDTFDESDDDVNDAPGDDDENKFMANKPIEEPINSDLNMSKLHNIDVLGALNQVNLNSVNGVLDLQSPNALLSLINAAKPLNTSFTPQTMDGSLQTVHYKGQPPSAPSSSLLAKLTAVTSRGSACSDLDQKVDDLLNAFYAINDNPEPSAIEMIARRIGTTSERISDWFDNKRLELNPQAGPRIPPVKKREGGRVVTFSEYQRSLLEAIFDENNYLHPQEYEELSNLIQVPSRNIKIWFKNRRSKQRLSGRLAAPGNAGTGANTISDD